MDTKKICSMVDHTVLKQTTTWEDIKALCDDAIAYGNRLIMMNEGKVILDIGEEEKKKLAKMADGGDVDIMTKELGCAGGQCLFDKRDNP